MPRGWIIRLLIGDLPDLIRFAWRALHHAAAALIFTAPAITNFLSNYYTT